MAEVIIKLAVKTRTWRKLGGGLCEPVDETTCVCVCVGGIREVSHLSLSHGNKSSVFCLVTGSLAGGASETSVNGADVSGGLTTDLTWRDDVDDEAQMF